MHFIFRVLLAAALLAGTAAAAQAQNLILNGSFETPIVPPGTYQEFPVGSPSIPRWVITGEPGSVAVISTTLSGGGFTFQARSGQQSLDLTGGSNGQTGVQQAVATTIGSLYELTFFVGNVYDLTGIFGASSTVDVYVNGTLLTSVRNVGGRNSPNQVWKKFSATFRANANTSIIAFINADPSSDSHNGLDLVSLVAQ